MTDPIASPARTVHSRTPKTSDIEIHVSTLETSSATYVDIREFVVSLEQYGRGITFPANAAILEGIHDGLGGVDRVIGAEGAFLT